MTWTKGQSGNPGGRKKGIPSFAEALRKALTERDPLTKQTALDRIAYAAVRKAMAGDLDAIKFIAERTDGKVPDVIATDGPIQHQHSGAIDLSVLSGDHIDTLADIAERLKAGTL